MGPAGLCPGVPPHVVGVPAAGSPATPALCPQDFVAGLSIILRGSVDDRLSWAFNLYDLNKDGCITKEVGRARGAGSAPAHYPYPPPPMKGLGGRSPALGA